MAYNQQTPFWDWARSFEDNGAGVDHPSVPRGGFEDFQGPPPPAFGGFGGWGWGPRGDGPPHPCGRPGGRGGRCRHNRRRDGSEERQRSRSRSGERGERTDEEPPRGPRHGRHGPRGHWGRRHRGPPPFAWGGAGAPPFDLSTLFDALGSSPFAQAMRSYAEQNGFAAPQEGQRSGETEGPQDDAENSFKPPIDVFTTEKEYVLHVALPGAKKEDVGVNWDAEKGVLNLAGVVYRQGDEDFLKKLSKSERKVGVFERTVKLPPVGDDKDEVDSDGISAKLEDGILVVVVPKIEKEWTEVKRVDIE